MEHHTTTSPNYLDKLPAIRGSYRSQAPLSKTNWFQVGGPAEVLFRPADIDDLAYFLNHRPKDIPLTVLGVGSNLLVRDGGLDGVVIKLGKGFTSIHHNQSGIEAGAGALCYNVAIYAASHGIGGLEFLSGIPGTIGGALAMNAGAYGADVASTLKQAVALDNDGTTYTLTPTDIGYIYRGNTLPDGMIFVQGSFKGQPALPADIHGRIHAITEQRSETQPIRSRTSGSTFKNPEGKKAWELIDAAGCRGLKIGDAQVSEKHCNFFLNLGQASAADIEALGEEVRRRVKEKTGIELEWEVKIIGKPLPY
jgi:UDP-N-acetylmuramate dehydrogenase